MKKLNDNRTIDRDAGIVLVGALWVMAFMALIVVSFVAVQQVELKISAGYSDAIRARLLARSGIEHAVAVLINDETPFDSLSDDWYENEEFEQAIIGDGYYTLAGVFQDDEDRKTETRYGLTDENGKVNINTAPKEILEKLPGMSGELAEAVIDWRDGDEETTGEGGAEADYYMRLDPPYKPKNGPFDTVAELLMVKGFSASVLYGEDANRNGILDANEDDGDDSWPSDDRDGELGRGIAPFVTVYSWESETGQDGPPRVNINEAPQQQVENRLGDLLPPDKITWIVEYRKASIAGNPVFPDQKYVTPANVVAFLPVPGVQGTPLTFDEYRKVADRMTVRSGEKVEGLINVNTAPKAVLSALPQLSTEDVDAIVARRAAQDAELDNVTWVYDALTGSDIEKLAKYQAVEPFVTVRSGQFTAHSVGVMPGRGIMIRLNAVIDRLADPPVFLDFKEETSLGPCFRPPTREEWLANSGTDR